jgi:hypothetical protein
MRAHKAKKSRFQVETLEGRVTPTPGFTGTLSCGSETISVSTPGIESAGAVLHNTAGTGNFVVRSGGAVQSPGSQGRQPLVECTLTGSGPNPLPDSYTLEGFFTPANNRRGVGP